MDGNPIWILNDCCKIGITLVISVFHKPQTTNSTILLINTIYSHSIDAIQLNCVNWMTVLLKNVQAHSIERSSNRMILLSFDLFHDFLIDFEYFNWHIVSQYIDWKFGLFAYVVGPVSMIGTYDNLDQLFAGLGGEEEG